MRSRSISSYLYYVTTHALEVFGLPLAVDQDVPRQPLPVLAICKDIQHSIRGKESALVIP